MRSGWARHWCEPTTYLGQASGVPGPDASAAEWIARAAPRVTGHDTMAYEHLPAGAGHALLPVHRILLVEHGVHILENLDLERLAADRVYDVPVRVPAVEVRRRYGLTGSADRRRAVTRSLTQHLADFAAQTTFDDLPAEVVHSVELRFLDTLGICLAARTFGLADGVQQMVQVWSGKPEARVIGAALACPAPNAALVNGTLAHSLDFDDTHLPSVLHPSASIVPGGSGHG